MKKLAVLIIPLVILLQGCVPAIIGGAVGGGFALFNLDHIVTYYKDSNIHYAINRRIFKDHSLIKNTHIVIAVYNQNVLIVGQTTSPAQRTRVEQIASTTPGVKRIYNKITVAGSSSELTHTSDAWITGKIKAKMLAVKNLHSENIKVVTENGRVYLMGNLNPQQEELAVGVARKVTGVERVVTLFGQR